MFKSTSLIIVCFLMVLWVVPAYALCCMPPVLNAEVIENAALIFEGTAQEKKSEAPEVPEGTERYVTYNFSIEAVWKGDPAQKGIDVFRNAYWGDGFQIGEKYLVVTYLNEGKHGADLCGNTTHIMSAGDKLEILKLRFPETINNIEEE